MCPRLLRRGETGGLPPGRDGLLQSGHPRVDLPGLHVRPLGPLGVTVFESIRHLLEHGCRLGEDRVRGILDHALGVDREQSVDKQGGTTADQRFQKAFDREAGGRGREGNHDDHRRDGGLLHADISPAQEHGQTHRQQHHRSGLQSPYADYGYEQVGEGDPEGDPERQLERPPAALAHC
jgi:hypothetical protein